jgi:hypothetical protein
MLDLVRRQEALKGNEATVWAGVARVVLNLDEFLNRE